MSVRAVLDRVLASRGEVDAAEERSVAVEQGCTPIADVMPRRRVRVGGVLRSVTVRPREGVRALAAELYDGSGALTLVFVGRREVRGIEAGRHLVAEGLVVEQAAGPVIFNPRYELRVTG